MAEDTANGPPETSTLSRLDAPPPTPRDTATMQQLQTQALQENFCAAFTRSGTIAKACEAIGITRRSVAYWRDEDLHGFRQKFRDAVADRQDDGMSRVLARLDKPEGNRGSDVLLIAYNNAINPDVWRGNNVTVDLPDHVVEVLAQLQALDAETRARQLGSGTVVDGAVVSVEDDKLPWEA